MRRPHDGKGRHPRALTEIAITPRRFTTQSPEDFRLFEPKEDLVPDMVKAGDGYRFHVTGLTHDERGYPSMNVETQDVLVRRMQDKLKPFENGRALFEAANSWTTPKWSSSPTASPRASPSAPLQLAREQGVRAGKFRIDFRLALPRTAHPRTRRPRQGLRRARAQHGPDGTRSRALRRRPMPKSSPSPTPAAACITPKSFCKAILEAAR